MARKRRNAGNLELIGGRLCLDFANTFTRTEALSHEYLHSYSDLLTWSQHAGVFSDLEVENLRQQAARFPVEAMAALDRALTLREAIYRIFSAVAHQQAPAPVDVTSLNQVLAEAPGHMQILASGKSFVLQVMPHSDTLASMLWPIAWSAADLLISTELSQVRQCARNEGCDWLFVDTSKNQSRRWCSMNLCGSRIKSRKYYEGKHPVGPGKSKIVTAQAGNLP